MSNEEKTDINCDEIDDVSNQTTKTLSSRPKRKAALTANVTNESVTKSKQTRSTNKKQSTNNKSKETTAITTIEMINDNTLDGFSIEPEDATDTMMSVASDVINMNCGGGGDTTNNIGDDEEDTKEEDTRDSNQNVVTFNLKDTNENSESNSQSQKALVKKRKRRCSAFYVDQSIG